MRFAPPIDGGVNDARTIAGSFTAAATDQNDGVVHMVVICSFAGCGARTHVDLSPPCIRNHERKIRLADTDGRK